MNFAAGDYLSEAQKPITPLSLLHTVYYSHREGGGGRGVIVNQRKVERGHSSQSWVDNTNMTDCISSL
jgi:hypothetical protein